MNNNVRDSGHPMRLGSFILGALALALSGCGGGGGGDDEGTPPPPPASFTVGGTITGLSGTVTLRLNGANDLPVTGSGSGAVSFAFTAPALANGATYAVTILAQPGTQVCGPGVVNGTGTINGANVTGVAITCSNYSIGGTVTGLTGSGLALQLNFANDLPVPLPASGPDTSFTFPSSVSLGGILYTIHIKTQPAGQTCTIVNSSGAVTSGAPNVSSAAVACIDNVTDALAGTYQLQSDGGDPVTDLRLFITFYPEGTYILGLHEDDPDCGASGHGGVEYGIYRWNHSTHAFEIRNAVIDTNGGCGIASGTEMLTGALVVNANGTLSGSDAESEPFTLAPVPSTADTLIGSWGDNQAFITYDANGKYFLAMTRAIVQNTATAAGIEDGCYSPPGTTASGSYTVDLSGGCAVSSAQTAADTTGPIGLSPFGTTALSFTVTGDSMQTTLGGVNALAFIPGSRIVTVTPPPSTLTISGTITGLNGSGLGLRLNGESGPTFNVNPGVGATSFAFPAQLQAGTAYRVTIVAAAANPAQFCFFTTPPAGTIGTSDVILGINCLNSTPYTASGNVTGLTGAGFTLRLWRADISIVAGAVVSEDLPLAGGSPTFQFAIPANNAFNIGILDQPAGQTCTITRASNFSIGPNVAGLGVACVNNATDPLSGTYTTLNEDGNGRFYFNFNADGTYTTALIEHDADCNASATGRNGDGVEYGVFSWDEATHAFELPVEAVVDTNDECGLSSGDGGSFEGDIRRVGNTIELRELPGDPQPLVVATAVESNPGTLIGAWIPEANNGELLVFHADGTFLSAETQEFFGLPSTPFHYGQERGCYSVGDSSVTLTIDATSCQPDGFAPYDLNNSSFNGLGGIFRAGGPTTTLMPIPFTIEDDETLVFNGSTFKRTHPN